MAKKILYKSPRTFQIEERRERRNVSELWVWLKVMLNVSDMSSVVFCVPLINFSIAFFELVAFAI